MGSRNRVILKEKVMSSLTRSFDDIFKGMRLRPVVPNLD